jgi:PadR family transcriptional regulator, regulatory protein PadR
MPKINGDALRGHLETLILSALRRGEAHGFEILRRLELAGSGALRLKEGSLYPALYRMESAGLIKGAWEERLAATRLSSTLSSDEASSSKSASNPHLPVEAIRRGPRRRVYRITTKGRARLQQARQEFDHFVTVIGGILGATS